MNKNIKFSSLFTLNKIVILLIFFWIFYTLSHGAYESLPYALKSLTTEDMIFLGFLVVFSEIGLVVSSAVLIINVFKRYYKRQVGRFTIMVIVIVIMLFFVYYTSASVYSDESKATIIINTTLPYVCGSERFQPTIVRVIIGVNNTITWKNISPFTQSIIFMNGSFSSGPIPPGSKWTYTFTKPGIYKYRNGFYPWSQGIIIVDGPQ